MKKDMIVILAIASMLLFAASCSKDGDGKDGDGEEPSVPAGFARVNGTIRDAGGSPLSGAEVHIVYEFEGAIAQVAPSTSERVLVRDSNSYNDDQSLNLYQQNLSDNPQHEFGLTNTTSEGEGK